MSRIPVRLHKAFCFHRLAWACAFSLAGPATAVWAQTTGPGLRITPIFGAEASYVHRSGSESYYGSDNDFVTRLSPGIQIASRSGRVRGTLDYRLDAVHHTGRTSGEPNIQNQLNAIGTAEVIESRLFVDASANIAQNAASPYGVQTFDSTSSNPNRIELATVRVAPRLVGSLGNTVVYNVVLNAEATNGRHSIAADSTTRGALVSLGSSSSGSVLGWSGQASTQTTDFRAGRATRSDRYFLSLNARPDVDWFTAVRVGQESTDVPGVNSQSYNNYGADLRWAPSPRTTASASYDKRYFGAGYNVLLEHRFKRSALRFTAIRDAGDDNANGTGVGQPVSLYALLYAQFATIQPDPALRDLLVRDFLRAQGLDPSLIVGGGFVNSLVTLQQREDLAYTYTGVRDTFTLQAFSSRSQALDRVSNAGNNSNVKQMGFTSTLSHRLTATASASLTAADLRTLSNGVQDATELRTLVLGVSEQLTRMITGALSLRYSDFDSTASPYRESAITASVAVRF